MAEKESKNKWHTPAERIMMLGFAAVILLGTILLCLPVSAAEKAFTGSTPCLPQRHLSA